MSGSSGIVVFNWDRWSALYPELVAGSPFLNPIYATIGGVTQPMAQALFDKAGRLYVPNNASALVPDLGQRSDLLDLVVAHLAALRGLALVGRIESASEGSVSVATAALVPDGSAEWWQQTRYGFEYWQAMASTRTFQYVPGPGARRAVAMRRGGPWGRF